MSVTIEYLKHWLFLFAGGSEAEKHLISGSRRPNAKLQNCDPSGKLLKSLGDPTVPQGLLQGVQCSHWHLCDSADFGM